MALKTDDNRIQEAHEAGHGSYSDRAETARQLQGMEQATKDAEALKGIESATDSAEAARNAEGVEYSDAWKTNVGPGAAKPTSSGFGTKITGFLKNKKNAGTLGGIIGGTGIIGLLFTLFGPMSMVISLTENLLDTNDGAESAFQSRILHVLGLKMADEDGLCETKHVKCKMGRISTKGLENLSKRGVVAYDADGNDLSKGEGKYPGAKIAEYRVAGIEDPIPAGQMRQHLANNPTVASKVLGRYGAFNVRFHVWSSKYMKKTMGSLFDWKKDGGIADGNNDDDTDSTALHEKIKERLPSIEGVSSEAQEKIRSHTEKLVDRGKKGGVAYLAAVGGCIGVKMPGLISNSVAAIQVARMLPLFNEVLGSPSSKNKASLISNISASDVAAVGALLTTQGANKKAAVDSKYLLAAMGVNKGRTGLSEKFTPGYSMLTHPAIQAMKRAEGKSDSTCNVVLSPQAMYTAAAINAAATVAASATIVGGVIKVVAEWGIGEIVGKVTESLADKAVGAVLGELASNDALDKVLDGKPGEELGDALGIASMAFFSAGAASRHVPVLKMTQLLAYEKQQSEQEEYQRNLDLASLSPFDTSSKYTFLGSIVNNTNMTLLANGGYGAGSLFSVISAPFSILSPSASASPAGNSEAYCGYADEFDMEAEDGLTPAVNASGLPCYGFSSNMSTSDALAIAQGDNSNDEKWIKDEAAEEADLTEIMEDDSRLAEYVEGCGSDSIANGEWQDAAAGCTVDTTETSSQSINSGNLPQCTGAEDEEQAQNCYNPDSNTDGANTGATTKSSNAREAEAVAAFAIDYQISQSVDGFDEEEDAARTTTNAGTDFYISSYNITTIGSSNQGRQTAVNQIKSHGRDGLDVIGTQELERPDEYNFVQKAMSANGYDVFPEPGGSVYRNSAYARSIFWKRDKFELVQTDEVTFNRMEAVTGGGRGGDPQPAHAPIVWLRDRQTGQQIIVMNTHNPAFEAYARERYAAAKAYMAKITALKSEGIPIFFTGDFNEGTGLRQGNNATYQQNIENLFYCMASSTNTLLSAHDTAAGRKSSCPAGGDGPIDYIYHSPGVNVESFNRITNSGSDHAALYAHVIVPSADAEGEVIAGPSKDGWVWPVPGVKTMGILDYGESGTRGTHKGIDIGISGGGALGRPVVAAHAGTVARVWGQGDACGAYVAIKADGTNYYAAYQHLDSDSITVRQGQTVTAGQTIAKIGRQGGSTCGSSGFYHLHFSIESSATVSAYANPHPNGTIDPLSVLPR